MTIYSRMHKIQEIYRGSRGAVVMSWNACLGRRSLANSSFYCATYTGGYRRINNGIDSQVYCFSGVGTMSWKRSVEQGRSMMTSVHGRKLSLHKGRRRCSTVRCPALPPLAMVNVDVSPSVILGVGLIGAGVSLWQIRQAKPWISRDYDVVISCISLLVGGILIFQGWRLDPLLLFGQLMTTGAAVSFAIEALKLRSEVYEDEERIELQDVFQKKIRNRGADFQLPPPPPGISGLRPQEEEWSNRRLKANDRFENDYYVDASFGPPREGYFSRNNARMDAPTRNDSTYYDRDTYEGNVRWEDDYEYDTRYEPPINDPGSRDSSGNFLEADYYPIDDRSDEFDRRTSSAFSNDSSETGRYAVDTDEQTTSSSVGRRRSRQSGGTSLFSGTDADWD